MTPAIETPTLTSASFEDLVREMIVRLGEDPKGEGLAETPRRIVAMSFCEPRSCIGRLSS